MLHGLNHLTLTTGDLDSSVAFYVDLLGCRPRVRWARGAYLTLGDLWLCLSCDLPNRPEITAMSRLASRLNSFQPSAPVCARRASWSGRRTAAKGIHSICWIPTGTDWKSMQATWIAASPLSDSNPMRVLSGSTEPNSPLLGTKMVVTIAALPQHALRQQMLEHPVHLLQRQ